MNGTDMRSSRLTYRALAFEHLEIFHRFCVDRHVRRYLLDGLEMTRQWAAEEIETSAALFEELGVGLWLVEYEGAPVGYCGYRRFEELHSEPQLLYALTEPHTGRGLATEMATTLLDRAWELGWGRVSAAVDVPNKASMRVLRKVGFEGCGFVPGAFGEMQLFECRRPFSTTRRKPRPPFRS